MGDAAGPAIQPTDARDCFLKFRLPKTTKERFCRIATELDTVPSVLLRKFVIAAVTDPALAGRILMTPPPPSV